MDASERIAYDLSDYNERKINSESPDLRVIKGRNDKSSLGMSFGTIVIALLLIGLIAATLYSNAVINELGNQINKANEEYSQLVSQNKKLTAVLESKVSLKNVENIAKDKLGLAKMEPYQIEYVNLLPEDKIEYIKDNKEEKITERILNSVNNFITKDSNKKDKNDKVNDD